MTSNDAIPEISHDGFQVVSGEMFKHMQRLSLPSATLWYNSISFSKASVLALNSCERVRIEVNPNTKCLLIVPVTIKDKDNIHWVKNVKDPQARKIECKAFTSQLFDTWGWKDTHVYRTVGRVVSVDKKVMLLFDFSDPESWLWKERAKAN